jgi:beta-1,4-mannooligosaccharide/beta-1,4-mannosyl-N-acetylglucosamine phosphorylase
MPLTRASSEPMLRPSDIPALRPDLEDVSGVFNPGAVRWKERDLLLLRVQTRGRTTVLVPAELGAHGEISFGTPLDFEDLNPPPAHVYDPRLTVIEDELYAVMACDSDEGCHLLTARTKDLVDWEIVTLEAGVDQRNGVLFPERIGGLYHRLQRPNASTRSRGPATGSVITHSTSEDLLRWSAGRPVMEGRPRRWDEWIGSGPPPVKTTEGWLHLYHGVATHFASTNVYQAGVVLLDLEDPSRVLARGAFNILEPRTAWELAGQVPNVVFPSGMIVPHLDREGFASRDSEVRVYYGAADTCVGLARGTIGELIEDARFSG